jgi:predicted O-methyltransferase YrrM
VPAAPRPSPRHAARDALNDLDFALRLRVLPRRVALTQLRARVIARRTHDLFSLTSATRPEDLATLLALARGRRRVVELGTGTAWTTIALALAQTDREIDSYDPVVQVHRGRYLAQVPHDVRARIHLIEDVGASGPRSDAPVDMLYVDSFHDRENTLAEVTAWTPVMAPGSIMVFDDYTHTVHTGVAQAIDELGLAGEPQGSLFIHRPSAAPRLS